MIDKEKEEEPQQPKKKEIEETQETLTSEEKKVRENPFGNATPIIPKTKNTTNPKQQQQDDDKFKKPFPKHFGNVDKQRSVSGGNNERRGQYNNNRRYNNNNRRENYGDRNNDRNDGRNEGTTDGWGVRGKGRQGGGRGGYTSTRGGRESTNNNRLSLNQKNGEEVIGTNNPLQGNHFYSLLEFDKNDPQVEDMNEGEEKNDS